MYTEGWLKNQLYLHSFACDLAVLCRESPGLERSLETMECQQQQQLPVLSVLPVLGGRGQQAAHDSSTCCLVCVCTLTMGANSLPPLVKETKGEISACAGTVERGESVPNTHNETPQWPEQCCDTDTAGQYLIVMIISAKTFPPHLLLQVTSTPDKAGIPRSDCTAPLL